jgi:DNA-directed RNA polymerase subunit M/transcription elongation factor TFIIS
MGSQAKRLRKTLRFGCEYCAGPREAAFVQTLQRMLGAESELRMRITCETCGSRWAVRVSQNQATFDPIRGEFN